MNHYSLLIASLGSAHGSDELSANMHFLPLKDRKLKKEGGYRASLTFKKLGVYLIFHWLNDAWILRSAMLYAGGVDGFACFKHAVESVVLPAGRQDVLKLLGSPARSGGGGPGLFIKHYNWDRYDRDGHSLRFEYESENGPIRMVTLMSRDLVQELEAAAPK